MNGQLRIALAVALAGIVGTIVNAFAASVIVDAGKLAFLYVPARYGVAIGVAILLPLLGRILSGSAWWIVSLGLLVAVPSVIAKLVLGVGAPWTMVVLLNGFYAVGAVFTYCLIIATRKVQ